MSEIAQRLGVAISTASGAVDHLVTTGFLTRLDDPANRRQVRVSATAAGLDSLEQMRELGMRQLRALLERVGDDDLSTVERAIRIMTEAIADHATAIDRATSIDHGSTV
jgi:DNA-binding MarR family transcriptional regulator